MSTRYDFNVGHAFDFIVQKYSDRTAFLFEDGTRLTYEAFDRESNRAAAWLLHRGLARRDVIGIVHTKTPLCFALMLGALKAGITYVNLDDQNPAARVKHIFGTARPSIVVGHRPPESICEGAREVGCVVVDLDAEDVRAELAVSERKLPDVVVTGADPAYIMYTSGSTGVPKGAIMTHANVLNFAKWIGSRFDVTHADTMTNVNPMYFDNSVFDFYGAILNGAALAPIGRDTVADGNRLMQAVEKAGCTLWFSVPSLLIYLTTMKLMTAGRLPALRAFVFGGEGYPKPELRKLHAAFGKQCTLINVYGPTECTCMCSAWDVREADLTSLEGFVTLGPIAENFSMLVLDEEERAVGPNGVGELCLLGPQVGLGYVNDPERTARSFAPNPQNARWRENMYRTGDLVRVDPDGKMLDFVGRKDNQIKHMGYRIELEEIESALNAIDGVVQSAVLHRETRRSMKIICAYLAVDGVVTEDVVRSALENALPPYMMPQKIIVRQQLPKNANGKVDRIALANETLE